MNEAEEQAEALRRITQEQTEHIEALRKRLDFLTARERQLEDDLQQVRSELETREGAEMEFVDAAIGVRDRRIAVIDDQLRAANRTIRMMQSTRVWQLGERSWLARDAVKRLLRRA